MNDKAVDKRLKEIEDDIKLLAGYLSEDIEQKMEGMLGDVRTGIEGLKKSIIAMPQPAAKGETVPQVNVGAIEERIVSLMDAADRSEKSLGRLEEVVGAKDLKDSGSLARHLHDVSGKLLQGIRTIDENLKKRPTTVAADTGTLTVDLSELLDTVKKAEDTLTASAEETRKLLSQGFEAARDAVKKELAELRGAVDKGLRESGASLKSGVAGSDTLKKELAAGQASLKKDLASTRDAIMKDIDSRQLLLKTNIASGNEVLKNDLDAQQKSLKKDIAAEHESLKKGISSVHDSLKNDLAEGRTIFGADLAAGLDSLRADVASVRESLRKDIEAYREQMRQETAAGQERLGNAIADGQATLKEDIAATSKDIADGQERLGKIIADGQTSFKKDLAVGQTAFQKELTAGLEKSIATNIGDSLGAISDSIDAFSKDIPAATGNIMHGVTNLDRKLACIETQAGEQHDEVKGLIERDHGNMLQIGEYLKKLGTSDEITAVRGNVVQGIEKLDTLLEQLAIVYSNIRQRLELQEKLVSDGTEQGLTRQDEIKKMVMYDLNAINDTTSKLKSMCETGSGNIGGLVAGISGQTSGMADIVPKIMETVLKQAEQLDRVSVEVRMMRWFVLGAVGVSLVTLAVSFFL